MDEFNKLFKETNLINIKQKAQELNKKADQYEKFFNSKRQEFENRNYVGFLSQISDLERMIKSSESLLKETVDLLKE